MNRPAIETHRLSAGDLQLLVTNFGCRVMQLWVPDREGTPRDVVLGHNRIEEYLDNRGERFLGAVCGRFANRIAGGRFRIGEHTYQLPTNDNGQTLHGGVKGLDSVVWEIRERSQHRICFHYLSEEGEEGFPGNLSIDVCYELTPDNCFLIDYRATTDRTTPVNLTHHSFFNLRGEGCGTINDHILTIHADRFLPIDRRAIPTGQIAEVEGTPFDFRTPRRIGERLDLPHAQLEAGHGYDHCWVLNGEGFRRAAEVAAPDSGIAMEVWTDQPGMQFYGGNFFDGRTPAKSGRGRYDFRGALALEAQLFPDAPNQPHFPAPFLTPERCYTHRCLYRFTRCDRRE